MNVPDPRNGRAGAVVNGRLYGFGGALDSDCSYTTSGYAYDPATNSWSATANMSVSRSEAVGVALNGRIHVIGGNPGCGAATGAHEVYDPATNQWSTETPMTARYSPRAAAVNGKIYVIGGFINGAALGLVEEFDPATEQWTTKAPMPTPRGGGAVAVLHGEIYVMGGCCGGPVTDNAFEVYNPATDTWTRKNPLPFNQSTAVAAGMNGQVYIFGAGNSGEMVQRYDPASDTWDTDAPMPVPVVWHFGGVIGNSFFFASGHSIGVRQHRTWEFAFDATDATPPSITVPADMTVDAVDAAGATVTFTTTATDNVGVVSERCAPHSGSVFPVGTTLVTCDASDAAGNSTNASFNVTVADRAAPVFGPLPALTFNASSPSGAQATYEPAVSDNVAVTSTSCLPATGSELPVGTTTVTCTASDAAGNTATGSFTVTVIGATEQMTNFDAVVVDLVIHEGTETSLRAKLDAARTSLVAGDATTACNQLEAMINQINAQAGKKLTGHEAALLLAEIAKIKLATGC